MDWSYYSFSYLDNEYQNSDDIKISLVTPFYPEAPDYNNAKFPTQFLNQELESFLVLRFYRRGPILALSNGPAKLKETKEYDSTDLLTIVLTTLLQEKAFDFENFSTQFLQQESFSKFPTELIPNVMKFCNDMLDNKEEILEKAKQFYIKEKL